ncbi:hypothetical protein A0J61_09611 [Choanephora cucurbitarum]|uniref:Uncharacterized protein n=1 Tax=Choanephora cucurbitarum TaxID=101091 RepID=A0A1C7N142_9FUNG|nr:hypothetical protein A0J61_09611 [Choanephora cucurbitarum]
MKLDLVTVEIRCDSIEELLLNNGIEIDLRDMFIFHLGTLAGTSHHILVILQTPARIPNIFFILDSSEILVGQCYFCFNDLPIIFSSATLTRVCNESFYLQSQHLQPKLSLHQAMFELQIYLVQLKQRDGCGASSGTGTDFDTFTMPEKMKF